MKRLPQRDVMCNLGLTFTKDGYELSNPAGTVRYDFHGVRTTASGIPEYFPNTLSVKYLTSKTSDSTNRRQPIPSSLTQPVLAPLPPAP